MTIEYILIKSFSILAILTIIALLHFAKNGRMKINCWGWFFNLSPKYVKGDFFNLSPKYADRYRKYLRCKVYEMCLRWRESDMKNLILTPDLAILSNPWRPMRSTNVTCIITKPKNTINTPVRFTTRYAPVNFFLLNQTNPVKAKSILFFWKYKSFFMS